MKKDDFFQMQIIYYSLVVAQATFFIVAFLASTMQGENASDSVPFIYIAPAITLSSYLMSNMLFNKMTTKDKIFQANGEPNMGSIKSAYIIRWAMVEGANLFTIVCLLITTDITFAYFFAGGLLLFLLMAPKKIWQTL